ncbi:uncharacterized protein B0I36DRAFT_348831 [Microdochium trichocladiopsis]|uniref:NACHT domain-containing protein n=1 Tax=Microdochium trichocladiopsis TaxID=1682393 RepID=A0A9P8Y5M9_9PEZI|nr:uncharacterized protein B0I36DRAFT_348831 [Microdochium trichocladiopsis]KAH7030625.1 hypothetical protein B0I36DRAFT_348831 [Microdochium trichocladiopsis]
MPGRDQFTIGWICAVDTECIAAQMMFDEVLDKPDDIPSQDANAYRYGRIAGHNVVVALLPLGQYGISSATSAVKDMIRTFPIRNVLMVGIAGGAPRPDHEPDIRLGDVVVSTPGNGDGGVLHYGFGKKLQDQEDRQRFQTTGHLNQPSIALLNAMNLLKTTHRTEGHQIQNCMQEALQAKKKLKPRTRRELQRPDPSTDRLFKPDALHAPNHDNCDHCGDGDSALVDRPPRDPDDDDDPMIHYGLIGCADELMKDAVMRDKLSREKGILCFEMEAAGLMNYMPSIAIRGICDYSDSHKNKKWQGYAAMTAAAYAKELLSNITPDQVLAEARLADKIDVGFSKTRWLSPADPSTNFTRALKQRHEHTGRWLLETPEYGSWKDSPDSFLWLHGKPGCGKTVLSSTVIQDLDEAHSGSHTLLYFYFDFSDTAKETVDSMVRSLVHQLYHRVAGARTFLDSLYALCGHSSSQPSTDSLQSTLESMFQSAGGVWLALDALDECTTRQELLDWIRHLRETSPGVSLIATSRLEQEIEASIRRMKSGTSIIPLQSERVHCDIQQYVEAKVYGDSALRRWRNRPAIQAKIQKALIEKANGIRFRWVTCQLDTLEGCKDPKVLDKALQSLPKTLDDTYNRIIERIPDEDRPSAIRILQLLAFSERPLHVEEVVDAIAVDLTKTPRVDPADRMPEPDEISHYCSGLTVVSETRDEDIVTKQIQLSHYSVKEWLESRRLAEPLATEFQEQHARAAIAEICIAYLLELPDDFSLREARDKYPFTHYSAAYWPGHASIGQTATHIVTTLAIELFGNAQAYYLTLVLGVYTQRASGTGGWSLATPCLTFAAHYGLQGAVEQLVHQGADANAQGKNHGNALQAASSEGYEAIVRLLVEHGADVHAGGGTYGGALQAASWAGREETVRLLVGLGADVNDQGARYGTPLHAAAKSGNTETVRVLVELGADIDAVGGYTGNALQAAIMAKHEDTVRLLIGLGADVNARGGIYGNALQVAASKGHEAIVRLLLDHGADVYAESGCYNSALEAAMKVGNVDIIRLLLG